VLAGVRYSEAMETLRMDGCGGSDLPLETILTRWQYLQLSIVMVTLSITKTAHQNGRLVYGRVLSEVRVYTSSCETRKRMCDVGVRFKSTRDWIPMRLGATVQD
jgi:hypothetical protein